MVFSWQTLQVVAISLGVTMINELFLWAVLYRTSGFRGLRAQVERQAKKLEELRSKEVAIGGRLDKRKRKEERMEAAMKNDVMRALGPQRLKTMIVSGLLMFATFRLVSSRFGGSTVAMLPFEPFAMLRKVSSRGLEEGAHPSQCSVHFVFMLCSMSLRPLVSKALGWGPSRAMNSVNAAQGASAALDKYKAT